MARYWHRHSPTGNKQSKGCNVRIFISCCLSPSSTHLSNDAANSFPKCDWAQPPQELGVIEAVEGRPAERSFQICVWFLSQVHFTPLQGREMHEFNCCLNRGLSVFSTMQVRLPSTERVCMKADVVIHSKNLWYTTLMEVLVIQQNSRALWAVSFRLLDVRLLIYHQDTIDNGKPCLKRLSRLQGVHFSNLWNSYSSADSTLDFQLSVLEFTRFPQMANYGLFFHCMT